MDISVKEESKFHYIETGEGEEALLLLHGLFGALSNFKTIIEAFSDKYNVVVPILPIFTMPIRKLSMKGLVRHVNEFVQMKGYKRLHVLGNSLGGHIALLFALENSEIVKSIILTGSSGLFESAMGSTFPKRGDYDFIKRKTESTFYDPKIASKELVDEVYDIVNDRNRGIRIVVTAKSAIRNNLEDKLDQIKAPTLLVWGKNDDITPPFVAEKFDELIDQTELVLFDKCGHAPMMEHPKDFNKVLADFLAKHYQKEIAGEPKS